MKTPQNEDINLRDLVGYLVSKWKVFVISTLTVILLATGYYIKTQKVFEMRSLVIINDEESSTDPSAILFETSFGDASRRINNEMVMLKSFPLIKKTIKDLGMDVQYYRESTIRAYEIYSNNPITVRFKSPKSVGAFGNKFHVSFIDEKHYKVEGEINLEKIGKKLQLSEPLTFGETFENPYFSFSIAIKDSVNAQNLEPLYFIPRNIDELSSKTGAELGVGLIQEESSVISLKMDGSTPNKWIDFINQLLNNYIQLSLDDKNLIAQNTIAFIDKELNSISDTLENISTKLKNLRSNGNRVQSTEGLSKVGQQILDLEIALGNTRLKQNYFETLFGSVTEENHQNLLSPGILGVSDPVLSGLMSEYVSLKRNLELLELNEQTSSPNYEQIKFRTASVKSEILKNLINIKQATDAQAQSLKTQITDLESSYDDFPALERKMIDLNRDFELNEKLYLLLSEKKTEAEITKSSNVSDIKVVERARMTSSNPKSPSKIVFPIALLLGLATAFLIAITLKLLDNKIQDREDLSVLGEWSYLGEVDQSKEAYKHDQIISSPKSSLAESFRIIRQNLTFFSTKNDASAFLVTSFIPGEGKTFISSRLSMTYGQTSKKVVLVDCDLRRSRIHKELKIPLGNGLSNYLAGQAELPDILQDFKELGISVITAGPTPPNPMELLLTDRMETLISQLKEEFDYVILDAPPLSIISDSFALEKHISSTILVCRSGYTPRDALHFYKEKIEEGQIVKPAFIVNGVKKSSRYSYGYKYSYYEDRPSFWKRMFSRS